jgi:CRP/FNR family cyclic AMP-dependent transcriptional regulator
MSSPYGLQIAENCEKCPLRKAGHFCCFDRNSLRELNDCSHSTSYPQHAVLTTEGQPARGVFIVCQGRVKLTSMSKDGKSVILRVVQAGEVIGVSAVVANRAYESSAETLAPSQMRFVAANDFLRIMRNHSEAAIQVAQSLSRECVAAYNEIRSLALAPSCSSKLATLLLSWCPTSADKKGEFKIQSQFTQEELAEMIGTTRETVTRLLSQFKKKNVLEARGAGFCVRNVAALEAMAV